MLANTTVHIALGSGSDYEMRLLQGVLDGLQCEVTISGYPVNSGVAEQPIGETMQGAINRARAALDRDEQAHLGCGIEFGYEHYHDSLHCVVYACVVNREGGLWIEHSGSIKLPASWQHHLHNGREIGDLVKEFSKTHPYMPVSRSFLNYVRKDDMLKRGLLLCPNQLFEGYADIWKISGSNNKSRMHLKNYFL